MHATNSHSTLHCSITNNRQNTWHLENPYKTLVMQNKTQSHTLRHKADKQQKRQWKLIQIISLDHYLLCIYILRNTFTLTFSNHLAPYYIWFVLKSRVVRKNIIIIIIIPKAKLVIGTNLLLSNHFSSIKFNFFFKIKIF